MNAVIVFIIVGSLKLQRTPCAKLLSKQRGSPLVHSGVFECWNSAVVVHLGIYLSAQICVWSRQVPLVWVELSWFQDMHVAKGIIYKKKGYTPQYYCLSSWWAIFFSSKELLNWPLSLEPSNYETCTGANF